MAVVAEAVFSGAGTVFSGAGTVLSGTRTVFSTVTVRAGGAGGAASSRLPPMRPRRNPTSSPKSSPTASVSKNALAGPDVLLAGPTLLLPIVLSLHSCRTRTRSTPWSPRKQVPRAHRTRPTAPTLQEGLIDRSYGLSTPEGLYPPHSCVLLVSFLGVAFTQQGT